MEFLSSKLQVFKLQHVLKITEFPEMASTVKFFFAVADTNRFSPDRSCSEKFRNIQSKTPVLKSLFNNVTGMKTCNFIKKRLQRRCFSVNIAKCLITLETRAVLIEIFMLC